MKIVAYSIFFHSFKCGIGNFMSMKRVEDVAKDLPLIELGASDGLQR